MKNVCVLSRLESHFHKLELYFHLPITSWNLVPQLWTFRYKAQAFKVVLKSRSECRFQQPHHLIVVDVEIIFIDVQQTGLVIVANAVENFRNRSNPLVFEAGVGKVDYPTWFVISEAFEMILVSILENFDNLL